MSMPHVDHDAIYGMHVYASWLVPRVDCVFRHRLACRFFLRARRDCDKTDEVRSAKCRHGTGTSTGQQQRHHARDNTRQSERERGAALTRRKEAQTAGRVSMLVAFFFISSDFVLHFRDCTRHGDHLRGGAAFLMNMSSGTAPGGFIGAAAGEIDLHGEF